MLDKKGRLFGKVSVVDLFAAFMVFIIVAVVYFNFGGNRYDLSAEKTVLITFYNPALQDFTANAVEIGAAVIDDVNETFLGNVVSVEIGESISFMPDIHGNEKASPMEGYSSVYITSRVQGQLSNGAVVLGGNVYGIGSEVIIWAGRAKTMLNISDIRGE